MTTMPKIIHQPMYKVTDIDGQVWYVSPDWDKCIMYILTQIGTTPFDKTFVIVKPIGDKNIYRIRLDLSLLSSDGSGVTYLHNGQQISHP